MPQSQSSAFISYHHSDRIIGRTLDEQLSFLAAHGLGKPALSSFLDAKDIKPGTAWQPVIDKNLREKDWLIVVFTGDQSVYSGYEIGTFSHLNGDAMKRGRPDKHIIGLYDVPDEALPVILKSSQNTLVPIVDRIVETQAVTLSTQEVNFWYQSPVGKFLVEFCTYRSLYTPAHERGIQARTATTSRWLPSASRTRSAWHGGPMSNLQRQPRSISS